VAAAWRAGGGADPGLIVVALAAVILGNVLEEQPHLAPYALLKHLRDTTQFPRTRGGATQPGRSVVDRLYPIFRALKAFRMFITVVPSLLLMYLAQAWTAAPCVRAYLYVALVAAAVYLAFQTVWYFDSKLENEIESMRDLIRADAPLSTGPEPEAASGAVSSSMAASARPMQDGRTNEPRTVSGAKRHEIPSRVVRELV
jgi:hypothetical protein